MATIEQGNHPIEPVQLEGPQHATLYVFGLESERNIILLGLLLFWFVFNRTFQFSRACLFKKVLYHLLDEGLLKLFDWMLGFCE